MRNLSFKVSPVGGKQQTQKKLFDNFKLRQNTRDCVPRRSAGLNAETGWSNWLLRNVGFQGHLTQQGPLHGCTENVQAQVSLSRKQSRR